jgi:hypothetical protein
MYGFKFKIDGKGKFVNVDDTKPSFFSDSPKWEPHGEFIDPADETKGVKAATCQEVNSACCISVHRFYRFTTGWGS